MLPCRQECAGNPSPTPLPTKYHYRSLPPSPGAHLDHFVPASADDERVTGAGAEANTADPVRVAVVLDGVLAVGQRVPQLHRLVPRARDDLTVVGREGHRQDVLGVALEPANGDERETVSGRGI